MTGQELKITMEKLNITAVMLAYKLGVTVPTIYALLKSKKISKLYTLAIKQIFKENLWEI
jgi:plasmid maintenance system antidote protein VapI